MKSKNSARWVVLEQVYTDRQEFLDFFYNAALEAAHRRTMSTVLLGQRRMGKTVSDEKTLNEILAVDISSVRKDMNPKVIRMWIFAHEGLTKDALAFAKKHGILWSSRKEFDELLVYLGLRPEL